MHLKSADDYRIVKSLINRGPRVVMLIYTTTCPHCISYMPIWDRLCKTKDKQAHMVKMEHSVYSKTPLMNEKPVSGIPTVLFVDPKGGIHEESDIRNETNMTNAITSAESSGQEETETVMTEDTEDTEGTEGTEDIKDIPMLRTSEVDTSTENTENTGTPASIFPRKATPYPRLGEENPLSPLPATPIRTEPLTGGQRNQRGGDPWSAFVAVARQAAPAAALLAAYGMLPSPKKSRSSGLRSGRRSKTIKRRS